MPQTHSPLDELCPGGRLVPAAHMQDTKQLICESTPSAMQREDALWIEGNSTTIMLRASGMQGGITLTLYSVPSAILASLGEGVTMQQVYRTAKPTTKIDVVMNLDARQESITGPRYQLHYRGGVNTNIGPSELLAPEGGLREGTQLVAEIAGSWYPVEYGGMTYSKSISEGDGFFGAKNKETRFKLAHGEIAENDAFSVVFPDGTRIPFTYKPGEVSEADMEKGYFNNLLTLVAAMDRHPDISARFYSEDRVIMTARDGADAFGFVDNLNQVQVDTVLPNGVKTKTLETRPGVIARTLGFQNVTAPAEASTENIPRFASIETLKKALETIPQLKIAASPTQPGAFTLWSQDLEHSLQFYANPLIRSVRFAESDEARSFAITTAKPLLGAKDEASAFSNALEGKYFSLTVGNNATEIRFTYRSHPDTTQGAFNSLNSLSAAMHLTGQLHASVVNGALVVRPAASGEVLTFQDGSFGGIKNLGFRSTKATLGAVTIDAPFIEATIGDQFCVTSKSFAAQCEFCFFYTAGPLEEVSEIFSFRDVIEANPNYFPFSSLATLAEAIALSGMMHATIRNAQLEIRSILPGPLMFHDVEGRFVKILGLDAIQSEQSLLNRLGITQDQNSHHYRQKGPDNMASGKSFALPFDPKDAQNPKKSAPIEPIPLKIYDAIGAPYTVTLRFLKIAPNYWATELVADYPEEFTDREDGQLGAGMIRFSGNGSLKQVTGSIAGTMILHPANGADPIMLMIDWGTPDTKTGIYQIYAPHNVALVEGDGMAAQLFSLTAASELHHGVHANGHGED